MKLSEVRVEEVTDKLEISDIHGLFEKHHGLGDCRPQYERVHQVAIYRGEWIGALLWDQTTIRNRLRDGRIGWSAGCKEQRRKCVVNNKRFLLSERYQGEKNLASLILGMATKRLSAAWEKKYKHSVLVAETFVNPITHEGTCYEAAGWEYIGKTKGYEKRDKESGKKKRSTPKKYYLKPLCENAYEKLSDSFPSALMSGKKVSHQSDNTFVYDVNQLELDSLQRMLTGISDPRSSQGLRYQAAPLLTLTVAGLLAGQQGYKEIHQWISTLPDECLERVGIFHRRIVSLSAFRGFLMGLDYQEVHDAVYTWLSKQHSKQLEKHKRRQPVIALDGKVLRGTKSEESPTLQALNLLAVECGVTLDQRQIQSKTNEIPVAQEMLSERSDLEGTVIVADALHTQKKTAEIVVKKKPISCSPSKIIKAIS